MRKSSVLTKHDGAGEYEEEIFECENPKHVIVCVHGGGVRRWDGGKFFYAVSDHYVDSVVMLVDQNQQEGDAVVLSPLQLAATRIQNLIEEAKLKHPGVPIIVMAHSMGCGVASYLDYSDVSVTVFVGPATGTPYDEYCKRFGDDLVDGKTVTTSDNLIKTYSKEFMASIKGVTWSDQYEKVAAGAVPTYVFECGADEIIGEHRKELRDIPFAKYVILEGAPHNLAGKYLDDFFVNLDPLLQQF